MSRELRGSGERPEGRRPGIPAAERARPELEAERDFLLRSLDDLENERAAGNVDDESYARLHDEYTARAAATIRALRDGVDARPATPPVPWRRRALIIGGIVAFAVVAAVALAAALGARLPGQLASGNESSGNEGQAGGSSRRAALEQAVEDRPDDIAARLALARLLEADGDLAAALREYDAVTQREPGNADALAQSGRILYLTASRVVPDQAAELVAAARDRLDAAVAADPEYADARFFRAVLLAQELLDRDLAIADAQRYLLLAPAGPFAEQARQLLADLGADVPAGAPPSVSPG